MQTRASLVLRIRDPNDGRAWSDFVNLYAPVLHAYGIKNHLQDADAADLAQDTLRAVLRAAPGFVYDPGKGSFHGWLFTVARNQLRKRRAHESHERGSGDTGVRELLESHPAADGEADAWEREYQLNLFHSAARRVQNEFRDVTWQAFWHTVVAGDDVSVVASNLEISTGAVYIARSRVAARIRQEVRTLEGE